MSVAAILLVQMMKEHHVALTKRVESTSAHLEEVTASRTRTIFLTQGEAGYQHGDPPLFPPTNSNLSTRQENKAQLQLQQGLTHKCSRLGAGSEAFSAIVQKKA